MPPKKKKGKSKGGEEEEAGGRPQTTGEPTDKEVMLKTELHTLTEQLDGLKSRVEDLRQENEWLHSEAHKVRVESHEYMSYMEKKTSKRQSAIISLSDQNAKEIQDIHDQKRQMLKEYEEKKSALRAILMEKENQMAKTKQELVDLQEYKNLQKEQQNGIRDLEKSVMAMRAKHSETIQSLKSRFLKDKWKYQQDSEAKISAMSKQANKEATQCLTDHTQRIKHENRRLRHELLMLIRKTRALHEHKGHLEDQQRQLKLEQQYASDLKTLRGTRQNKVMKSMGIVLDEDDAQESGKEGRKTRATITPASAAANENQVQSPQLAIAAP